jgi:hypothetical protein
LADRAASPSHRSIGDDSVLEYQLDRDLVTAQGIVTLGGRVGMFDRSRSPRVAVMVEDDLAIELLK